MKLTKTNLYILGAVLVLVTLLALRASLVINPQQTAQIQNTTLTPTQFIAASNKFLNPTLSVYEDLNIVKQRSVLYRPISESNIRAIQLLADRLGDQTYVTADFEIAYSSVMNIFYIHKKSSKAENEVRAFLSAYGLRNLYLEVNSRFFRIVSISPRKAIADDELQLEIEREQRYQY